MLFNKVSLHAVGYILSISFVPGNTAKYLLSSIRISAQHLTLNALVLLITWRIRFLFKQNTNRKYYIHKPKIIDFNFSQVILPTSSDNVSN